MRNEFVKQKWKWMKMDGCSHSTERGGELKMETKQKKVKKFMIHSIPFHFISNGHLWWLWWWLWLSVIQTYIRFSICSIERVRLSHSKMEIKIKIFKWYLCIWVGGRNDGGGGWSSNKQTNNMNIKTNWSTSRYLSFWPKNSCIK